MTWEVEEVRSREICPCGCHSGLADMRDHTKAIKTRGLFFETLPAMISTFPHGFAHPLIDW